MKRLLILICSFFLAINLCLTTQTYICGDASWLMEASKRLLAGGSYSHSFIETNPPLILFIYAIPVLLTSWIGSLASNFLLFIYGIIALSLMVCYAMLKRLMPNDRVALILFFSGLAFSDLIVPVHEFGQREHLTLLLIMPYLLMSSSLNTSAFPARLRYTVGLMAGIGFAIKPHFLVPLCLILSWQVFKKRGVLSCFNIENVSLFAIMFLSWLAALIITPDYFSFMLPLVFKFYLPFKVPLSKLLTHQWTILFYFVIVLGAIQLQRKKISNRNLYELLMLSNVGFFLVFILGGHFYYYHFLIVAALSVLLLMLNIKSLLEQIKTKSELSTLDYLNIAVTGFSLFFIIEGLYQLNVTKLKRDSEGPIPQLIKTFETINRGPYVVLSNHMDPNASLMTYTKLRSSMRLPLFWILPSIGILQEQGDLVLADEGKTLLRQILIEDLLTDRPYIIIVPKRDLPIIVDGQILNYLDFFLEDTRFKTLWKQYQLRKTIESQMGDYAIYTL